MLPPTLQAPFFMVVYGSTHATPRAQCSFVSNRAEETLPTTIRRASVSGDSTVSGQMNRTGSAYQSRGTEESKLSSSSGTGSETPAPRAPSGLFSMLIDDATRPGPVALDSYLAPEAHSVLRAEHCSPPKLESRPLRTWRSRFSTLLSSFQRQRRFWQPSSIFLGDRHRCVSLMTCRIPSQCSMLFAFCKYHHARTNASVEACGISTPC